MSRINVPVEDILAALEQRAGQIKEEAKRRTATKINFTKPTLDSLPLPEAGKRAVYHDTGKRAVYGLQLRVTAAGVKTFTVFKRVAGGRPERVTLGRYPEITVEQARRKATEAISDLAHGKSPNEAKRAKKVQSLTLKEALEDYTEKKRRSKDGLPLKERTRADYMAMVAQGRERKNKTRSLDGELFQLATKPIHAITANDIRDVHAKARGERRAAYAMQVLRAVLNWHGVAIADNPLGKDVAGKRRIRIPQARATGRVIPPERIGAWWNAAQAGDSAALDYLRFCLLTGCRPAEPLKALVADCDLVGGRVLLRDTKNRSDFTLVLSTQALQIVKRHAEGKRPADHLFGVTAPRKAMQELTKATGIEFTTKTLRATFASVAETVASAYTLKRMMNHAQAGDVTGQHYVRKGEAELRAGWQAVADWIDEQARIEAGKNVVQMPREAA